jgi:hypothetical protein
VKGWVSAGLLIVGAVAAVGEEAGVGGADPALVSKIGPFLQDYCIACHGQERKRAEIDLERLITDPRFDAERELWEKVRATLAHREMPPENRRQPEELARQALVDDLLQEFARQDAAMVPNPGAVTLRRLNRNEYRNTVRDLLGVDYDTHANFPHDESGYGFDNIGDVLSLSPMLLEKYLSAAEDIATRVITTEDPALKRVQRVGTNRFKTEADAISTLEEDVWAFYREGEIVAEHEFAVGGEYRLRIQAYGEQAGSELPKMGVRLDGREIHVQSVKALEGRSETFEVPVVVEAGRRRLGVAYLNNFNSDGDRNVFMRRFEVVGPLGVPAEEYPAVHRRILPRRPLVGEERAYATEVLGQLAGRAFRRPATALEVERLVRVAEGEWADGGNFESGIQLAVQAVLVSPHFLYRWELDPPDLAEEGPRELNDYEVASRLSYFLWASMPDDTLYALAAAGELREPEVRDAQVRRMLRDDRAWELVRQFGGQWLQVRNLAEVAPDPSLFPGWDEELRAAMVREAELFLWALWQEDRRLPELLDADFTFLNERLAKHYGIEGVTGDAFQRVSLGAGSGRGGVLTLGSVLTVTSVPTRTAPVLRGKWILEQILGTPPPPPPPDVPAIEEGAEAEKTATLRQRLELHRSKPECMTCHQRMDPLGFALENFDAVGAWRTQDGPHPIDNAAELPGGRKFAGATGLKEVLRAHPDFPKAFTEKLLTYALGRGLEGYDRLAVADILARLEKNDFKLTELVLGIASSEPFLKRQPTNQRNEQHAQFIR